MIEKAARLSRSQLAIPADNFDSITDALGSDADQILLDLEDSLHTNEKAEARRTLVEAVRAHDWDDKPLCYRINGIQSRWWYDDVIEIVGEVGDEINGIVLPKVRDPSDVETVENLLEQVEVNAGLDPGRIALSIQIEDATGMSNVERIVHASDRLDAVIFGLGDYSTSIGARGHVLGINEEYPGHYWHYPLSRISHAATSADLLAIDGLYTNVDDSEGFRKSCTYARMLGYDGKWVIHPDQTAVANQIFSPTREEAEKAERIVDTYEAAGRETIPTVDGKVIDQETVEMARHIVQKARQAGVIES